MVKLDENTKAIMADFLDSLRDYMHESHDLLCFDERESDDFVDTYEKQLCNGTRQPQSGRHLIIPDVNTCAKKLQVADKALSDIIKCEEGHEDFKYQDVIEIATRAKEQMMKVGGF